MHDGNAEGVSAAGLPLPRTHCCWRRALARTWGGEEHQPRAWFSARGTSTSQMAEEERTNSSISRASEVLVATSGYLSVQQEALLLAPRDADGYAVLCDTRCVQQATRRGAGGDDPRRPFGGRHAACASGLFTLPREILLCCLPLTEKALGVRATCVSCPGAAAE